MLRVSMLRSFRGTIDVHGIRTFRPETDDESECQFDNSVAEFWAVLSDSELPRIRIALAYGDRQLATRLIAEGAAAMGSILPR